MKLRHRSRIGVTPGARRRYCIAFGNTDESCPSIHRLVHVIRGGIPSVASGTTDALETMNIPLKKRRRLVTYRAMTYQTFVSSQTDLRTEDGTDRQDACKEEREALSHKNHPSSVKIMM
jgi:hypothetical protein